MGSIRIIARLFTVEWLTAAIRSFNNQAADLPQVTDHVLAINRIECSVGER